MATLEYVASGCNYTRLPAPGAIENFDNVRVITEAFNVLNGNKKDHSFSLMYNACYEKHFGKIFTEYYKPHLKAIHADSGGLQMVTQGTPNTPELRQQVYENQGQWSDIAMSFDEIPVSMVGTRSGRLEMGNRFFDKDRFEECAINTGKNLKDQLESFEKVRSTRIPPKPYLIAQGNCLESYQQWVELILKQIPNDLAKNIGGVAMGGAALGVGPLEDIKKAFYFSQLPINCAHVHLLGVGSVTRLLPVLIFSQNKLYLPETHISYDSSSHSSGGEMGRYYYGEKTHGFSRVLDDKFVLMYNDIVENFPNVVNIPLKDFYRGMTCGGYIKAKEIFGSTKEAIQPFVLTFASSVKNFMAHVDRLKDDKEKLLMHVDGVERAAFDNLYDVATAVDFSYWENHFGKYFSSQPVKSKQTSIDMLF